MSPSAQISILESNSISMITSGGRYWLGITSPECLLPILADTKSQIIGTPPVIGIVCDMCMARSGRILRYDGFSSSFFSMSNSADESDNPRRMLLGDRSELNLVRDDWSHHARQELTSMYRTSLVKKVQAHEQNLQGMLY